MELRRSITAVQLQNQSKKFILLFNGIASGRAKMITNLVLMINLSASIAANLHVGSSFTVSI